MRYESFDGGEFRNMLIGSANRLAECRDEIDRLNVFPVPDGDTGTNMYLTLLAGVKEAGNAAGDTVGEVSAALARGCLLGARGNSGVILSQIMQGFATALEGKERAGINDVTEAFNKGVEYAYRAVSNPVEGTILTVARAMALGFEQSVGRGADLLRAMVFTYKQSCQALASGPELLPVLREAGVVDAGGKGLVVVVEGILNALKLAAGRRQIELFDLAYSQQREHLKSSVSDLDALIEFTYCTELIIKGQNIPMERLRSELEPYGDSLMVVGIEDAVKVHIHSNHPGLVLECCIKYGMLHNVQVNNMEEQHREFRRGQDAPRPLGVVAVACGEGLVKIMESLGVDMVVAGGQTMNTSADELLQAINRVNAENIILLPNNKNIIMAAQQAASLSSKAVHVIPTRSVPQGFAAMMAFNPYGDPEAIAGKMTDALDAIQSGEITRAVRNTRMGGVEITAGDYIALYGDEISASGRELFNVTLNLIKTMMKQGSGLLTLYYGGGLPEKDALAIIKELSGIYGEVDFELHYGGQPLYQFIISAE